VTQIRFFARAPEKLAVAIADNWNQAFEESGYPCSSFEVNEKAGEWEAAIYLPSEQAEEFRAQLANALEETIPGCQLLEESLEDTGWVEKTLEGLAPVRAGQFIVYGSHDAGIAKPNDFAIMIEAGMAFGTGHHGTTAGCLKMINAVLKRSSPKNALDLGAGTGVLAIAVALADRIPVLATDIDPVATEISAANARLNGVGSSVRSVTADGFENRAFAEYGPFDLVVANILAGPLQKMARQLAQNTAPSGSVILSGLLPHQKARIVSAYRQQGLLFEQALYQDGWMILLFRKPG
jgi:ribosomal protein L11 methyltransferase